MKLSYKFAALGLGTAMLAAFAGPAMANSVNVSLTSSTGTRTLALLQSDGTTPLTATDLSSGTSNFIAKVTDSSYTNNGFKVQATMSNLYAFANSAYNCNSMVPSSAITLSSPTGGLNVAGVSANLTPVFTITGTLTSAIDPLIVNPLGINTSSAGQLPVSQSPLSQSQITGSNLTNLFGSTLASVESKLPVSLDTTGLGGTFSSPDVHPTCDTGATGATQVPVMSGTADPTGLLGALESLIASTLGCASVATCTPTLTQLINAGYLTNNEVSAALQPILDPILGLTGLTNDLTSIENTLTSTISALTDTVGSLIQSGTYSSSPALAVDTSKVPAAGTYKGLMTVTLVDS